MSKSRVQYIRLGKGPAKEEIIGTMCFGICMVAMFAMLWSFTSWEICKVVFGAMLISALLVCLAAVLLSLNREYQFRRKCMKIRKERTFYNIIIEGELVEVPIEGTDLVEIRNIVMRG